MKVRFSLAKKTLPHHLADAEVVFEGHGPLRGLTLDGFAIWGRRDGGQGLSVTVPSRCEQRSGETQRHEFLRGDAKCMGALKAAILGEFVRQHPEKVGALLVRASSSSHDNDQRS